VLEFLCQPSPRKKQSYTPEFPPKIKWTEAASTATSNSLSNTLKPTAYKSSKLFQTKVKALTLVPISAKAISENLSPQRALEVAIGRRRCDFDEKGKEGLLPLQQQYLLENFRKKTCTKP